MIKFASIFVLVLTLTLISSPPVNAQEMATSREIIVYNDTIYVYGHVLPSHQVIVDEKGSIIKIVSNTEADTVPRVFVNTISVETEIKLSDDTAKQYHKLVPAGSSKVGVLYERNETPTHSYVTFRQLLSIVQPMQWRAI